MYLLAMLVVIFAVLSFYVHAGFIAGSIIFVVLFATINYNYRHSQIEDLANLKMNASQKKIYQDMADTQLLEFKKYLAETYPAIEKSIFESITSQNVGFYAVKYPEIKSNETILKLVSLINEKMSDVYQCELRSTRCQQRIDVRLEDSKMWCLPGVVSVKIDF